MGIVECGCINLWVSIDYNNVDVDVNKAVISPEPNLDGNSRLAKLLELRNVLTIP